MCVCVCVCVCVHLLTQPCITFSCMQRKPIPLFLRDRYVVARIPVWTNKGEERLKNLFARMGVSLQTCKQVYKTLVCCSSFLTAHTPLFMAQREVKRERSREREREVKRERGQEREREREEEEEEEEGMGQCTHTHTQTHTHPPLHSPPNNNNNNNTNRMRKPKCEFWTHSKSTGTRMDSTPSRTNRLCTATATTSAWQQATWCTLCRGSSTTLTGMSLCRRACSGRWTAYR